MKLTKIVRHLTALLAVVVVASCTLDAPTAPTPPEASAPVMVQPPMPDYGLVDGLVGTLGRVVGGLLTCEPEPFVANSAVIGRAGGTIRFGSHTLTIPAGALERNVRISGQVPSDTVNSIRLFPEGLEFDRPASLTMSYDNCGLLASTLNLLGLNKPVRIAYTTDALRILYYVPSIDDPRRQKVTGYLDHFSRYAVGW